MIKTRLTSLLIICVATCLALSACSRSDRSESPSTSASTQAKTEQSFVSVSIGPTDIPNGDAVGLQDISVRNAFFALGFAVETASPWGVARGGILDIAIMREGKPSSDFVSLVDFMPNYWSAWPSTYQRVSLLVNTPERVVIRCDRDWGEVTLQTHYEIRADSNVVQIKTQMTNHGMKALNDLTTGYIAWPNGGELFGMPGITEGDSRPISEHPALGKWSASYDESWALGLTTPYSDLIAYTGRDRYLKHNLAAGETKQFEAQLQIIDSADLSRFVENEIDTNKLPAGRVFGRIENEQGQAVGKSALILNRQDKLYAWVLAKDGYFDTQLPIGEYEVYASAADHAPGSKHRLQVVEGASVELALSDIKVPGVVSFNIIEQDQAAPLDAMISITKGTKPVIQYFGKPRFFTELSRPGFVELSIAPGDYEFEFSAGAGFTSMPGSSTVTVESAKHKEVTVPIEVLVKPAEHHWYSADLHHHSDVLDGFTEPEYVLRSQLAAGVDISFLSDHDSTQNNQEMAKLSAARGMSFIAGTELSASWAHFNAYPIDADKTVDSNIGLMTVQEIFSEARRLGADVIHVNHPFGNYGYFDSLKKEQEGGFEADSIVPGGYDLGFDLIEITTEHQQETLDRAWQLWNQGKHAYFSAGSDVHDVWRTKMEHSSGAARSYVHLPHELSIDSYITGLKAGHSFATQGPIVYPELMFGSEIEHGVGQALQLAYQVQALSGLESVQLIEQGVERERFDFTQEDSLQDVVFTVQPETNTWYSLVVKDARGNYAYTNPVWVNVSNSPALDSREPNKQ